MCRWPSRVFLMYELKKIVKVFTSKFVGTGPSSYEKRIYRAVVSQRLRNPTLEWLHFGANGTNSMFWRRLFHHLGLGWWRSQIDVRIHPTARMCVRVRVCVDLKSQSLSYRLQRPPKTDMNCGDHLRSKLLLLPPALSTFSPTLCRQSSPKLVDIEGHHVISVSTLQWAKWLITDGEWKEVCWRVKRGSSRQTWTVSDRGIYFGDFSMAKKTTPFAEDECSPP
jgi:hypothetical protein